MKRLQNKRALITGGGSGIGKAAALLFAEEGAAVAVLGRTQEEIKETAEEIESAGGKASYYTADISDAAAMEKVINKAASDLGGLDIVFANAGVNGVWAPIDEMKPEEWYDTININLNGTFHTIKYSVTYLKKAGGSVIITSSVNGTRIFSNTGATAYSCTKAAQAAMAKMLAVELGKYKIRVNVICPGYIKTEIQDNTEQRGVEKEKVPVEFPEGDIPLTKGKPGSARQAAQLALFLASDESDHISGTEVWIDGAESLIQ